jgi:hypothetical protein
MFQHVARQQNGKLGTTPFAKPRNARSVKASARLLGRIGLLAHHLLESMVNPRAARRPLVSALIA